MDIKPEKFKELLRYFFERLKRLDAELTAHRLLLISLKKSLDLPELDVLLEEARNNPGIADRLKSEYDLPLQTLLSRVDEALAYQALEDFLRSWKPKGPPN